MIMCCLTLALHLFFVSLRFFLGPVLFRFRLFAFIEAAGLRSIVLQYTCIPTATRSYLTTAFFCFVSIFLGRYRFFRVI